MPSFDACSTRPVLGGARHPGEVYMLAIRVKGLRFYHTTACITG